MLGSHERRPQRHRSGDLLVDSWSVPVSVAAWVRLYDLNGNPASDWSYQSAARIAVGSQVTYPSVTLDTIVPQYVRAAWHVELYYGSNVPFLTIDGVVQSYKSIVDMNQGAMFGGVGKVSNGTARFC